jgi:predicted nucleotidyltransferase
MRPDSDIDILVEFLPETKLGWEFFDLEEELARLLGRRLTLGRSAASNRGFIGTFSATP